MIDNPRSCTIYPFDAWKLTPGFQVKKVTIVQNSWDYGYQTESNGAVSARDLYSSRAEAIEGGRARLISAETRLKKQKSTLKKRAETLEQQAFTI